MVAAQRVEGELAALPRLQVDARERRLAVARELVEPLLFDELLHVPLELRERRRRRLGDRTCRDADGEDDAQARIHRPACIPQSGQREAPRSG
ncbi:hypothetical protein [Nannocystis exedens]|uniref:hypothetical protein n=1 Tax=Nannocystis exedens TaxID=54 RepID=UPI00117CE158|nr:hypothetical protein [Nannocystis exedens]